MDRTHPGGDDMLYSQREKRRGGVVDTLTYTVPKRVRTQVVHIWNSVVGPISRPSWLEERIGNENSDRFYGALHSVLCKEYGEFALSERGGRRPRNDLLSFFLEEATDTQALDVIECSFQLLRSQFAGWYQDAERELNRRFRLNSVGYALESGFLIKKDSEILHQNVVRPTLTLLADARFTGANQEYLNAHNHFRHDRHEECLVDCLKSFESTLKTICTEKGWSYDTKASASGLIDVCIANNLLPTLFKSHLIAVATVRNKYGGHGQGPRVRQVPTHYCAYALHLTAVHIKLLVDAAGL